MPQIQTLMKLSKCILLLPAAIFFLSINHLEGQEKKGITANVDYPEGIYNTFNDFLFALPSDTITQWTIKIGSDTISNRFYNADTGERLKDKFAFIEDGRLYVQVKEMMKRFERADRGQLKDDGSYHLKAQLIGSKYIYFEDYFTSREAVLWGGAIAGASARRLKGIVFEIDFQTFNLFRNAEDFESFVKTRHPSYLSRLENSNGKKSEKRKNHFEDITLIRTLIKELING